MKDTQTKECLAKLLKRSSLGAKYLTEPAPSSQEFLLACSYALCAPDHGRLRPYRFVQIHNRDQLADCFAQGALEAGGDEAAIQKARSKAYKAPALVAVITQIDELNSAVPAYEQWMTTGAATSNFLTALEMLGYAGKIVSGSSTEYRATQHFLCQPGESVAAWIMLGTPCHTRPDPKPRAEANTIFSEI